jgi:AcrR family transcriptional regulator
MARRPNRKSSRPSARPAPTPRPAAASAAGTDREKIIAAFMTLLAETPFERIGLAEIAKAAGVSLTELRDAFPSKLAIYAAHVKAIDRAVLAQDFSDMADESPRERLFDVLMRRLEVMAPHREAMRSLLRSVGRNAPLTLALNRMAVRSQQWMLTAADLDSSGPLGLVRAQGLAALFGSVLRTWVRDDDSGLARTMAALDRALGRGQRWSGFLEDLCRIPRGLCRLRSRLRRRRDRDGWDDRDDDEAADSVAA